MQQDFKALIEKTLLEQISLLKDKNHPLLLEAASYSLLGSGKRLRPLLTLITTESLGGDIEKALVPACAIEMIHTYSLIHDDLPCMDDDDMRRGRPTLHKVYPEGQAVLTGDLLLTFAFELLASHTKIEPKQSLQLITVLSQRAGGLGMILGQSLDLSSEGTTLSWPTLEEIHQRKTADLLSACLEFGGICAKASTSVCKTLANIGQNIGLSYQIVDDILDVEGDPLLLGSSLFSDVLNKKSTSVTLLAQ
jgi:geranylgeranyl diphosphate synthase, type II